MYADKKNFLIVTASIGAGHNRAAEAIADEIKIKYPAAKIQIVDFMSSKTAYLNGFLKEAYLKMLNLVPDVYEFLYAFTAGKARGTSLQSLLAMAMKNDMEALVKRCGAEVVICTHPFPCAAAAYLKKAKQADFILAGVITDFAVHQLWVYREVDLYFVANELIQNELAGRGIALWKIHNTGIPIAPSFRFAYDRKGLLDKFGLCGALPIILLMGGGLGLGGVKIALLQLEKLEIQLQILVVTGENPGLWADMKKYGETSRHRVQAWGFSKNVQELMAVATLLISKPGALTISEALAMELPMLLNEPIPGQEKENAAYVEKIGAAVWIKDSAGLAAAVEDILLHTDKLSRMHERAKMHKKPDAAQDIVRQIDAYLHKGCGDDAVSM